jgi:hypothetical protein
MSTATAITVNTFVLENGQKFEPIAEQDDFGHTISKRQYNSKNPNLVMIGAENFDSVGKIATLKLNVSKAARRLAKRLKTADESRI